MSYIGTNKIGKMYLGGTEIAKAYLGSNLVYQNTHYSTISGITPLTFQAKSGDIRSLIQYGKCEQRNDLPPGCVEIEYLQSTGTEGITTGVNYANGAVNIELDVEILPNSITGNSAVFGVGTATGQWFGKAGQVYGCGSTGSNSDINIGTRIIAGLVLGNGIRLTINGNYIGSRGSGVATRNFWLFKARDGSGYAPLKLYYAKIRDANNVMVRDMIPVRVGTTGYMYDRVSGQLFSNFSTGNFILGPDVVPTPDKPIDIWCNNGVLKAKHQSGLPLGYTRLDYIESTGTQYIDTGVIPNQDSRIFLDVLIPRLSTGACSFGGSTNGSWTPGFIVYGGNTTYKTASVYNNSDVTASSISYAANVRYTIDLDKNIYTVYNGATRKYYYSHPTGNFQLTQPIELFRINISTPRYGRFRLYLSRIYQDDVLVRHYIPSKNYNNEIGLYDLVTNTFFVNSGTGDFIAGNEVSDPIEIYTNDTPEVLTISATGQSTQTATAKNLLQVGSYKDTQDIISGHITRKVGILILDGTENWTTLDQYGRVSIQNIPTMANPSTPRSIEAFCNYFENLHSQESIDSVVSGQFYIASQNGLYFHIEQTSAALFKNWLTDQYNAGTPVIVIYPLATETTESVTAQHLTTTSGENTIDITANVSDISVEVECLT